MINLTCLMKKFSFYLILFCSILTQSLDSDELDAKWIYVSTSENGADYYFDIDSIKSKNGFLYVWSLQNYPEISTGSKSFTYSAIREVTS